jgi:ABC-type lipoprotein export system ATPase subunit
MIVLKHVEKAYSDGQTRRAVLVDVNLTIEPSEFVSVMGPSGSGKSTLLNLVGGLDSPSAGAILVDGVNLAQLGDQALTTFRRSRIGLIFQSYNLLPTLDVLSNVLLPVQLERRPVSADEARAKRLLEEVGLLGKLGSPIYQLSGGEMQRVAIARALIRQPPIILADEPTGNLDSVTSGVILRLLRQVREQHRTTIVMVTHDEVAANTGERIVRLRDGRVVGDEPTERSSHELVVSKKTAVGAASVTRG